ncbi:diguanylate cyclase (GGDEF)-like protein [Granulicella aggregans]|uniref:diguanylate cyclase n=1 Tax=Granulicella aggregans TaxID=474949 RepID=A0A7W7ZFD1_9BACT|nr:GGDEF domain-containing protein [Granulicella aggregans]MBB5058316.1 diguanylate cyclase (GGDEF)-like protein [Granulicella aggregans]
MHILSWLDPRTLLASQLPLAAAFALVLLAIRRTYPNPRGSNAHAYGFLLWVPATMLLLGQGGLRPFASVVIPSLIYICAYIMMYRGTISFFESKGALSLVYDAAAVTAAVVLYFTAVYDLAVPRLVAMAAFVSLIRGMMAVEFYRRSNRSFLLQVLAGVLCFSALVPLCFAVGVTWPVILMQDGADQIASVHMALETLSALGDLAFLCSSGLFAVLMFLAEVAQAIKQQGQLDPVTGTLNRYGIEDALDSEVARSSRTHSPVSVMLIEVDHFKSIADTHGAARSVEALKTVVKTVSSILRFYDKCGRVAEDRFFLLLPENAAEHAMVIAGRFREALKSPSLPHDQPAITLSIGVTQCAFKEPAGEVFARAELALLEARRQGRNGAYLKLPNHEDVVIPHPDRIANRSRVAKLIR